MKEAAATLGVKLHFIDVKTPDDLPAAFEAGSTVGAQGVLTTAESIFRVARGRVTELAARHRLPAVYPFAEIALENGGLMAYDLSVREVHRSVADYVDRILKGAKPTDLPIQQPTVFQPVINLKTAKALGLTLPTTLLARADEVIEE
jgi:putative ABC transport system substrate-binding protein